MHPDNHIVVEEIEGKIDNTSDRYPGIYVSGNAA
jgi:hypothetical protein